MRGGLVLALAIPAMTACHARVSGRGPGVVSVQDPPRGTGVPRPASRFRSTSPAAIHPDCNALAREQRPGAWTSTSTLAPPGRPPGGVMDRDAIRAGIGEHKEAITACYLRYLARPEHDEDQKTLSAYFVISTTGAVSDVCARRSTGDAALDACTLAVVAQMTFPAPRGGTVAVTYPFVFRTSF